jgi:hypothetical protein
MASARAQADAGTDPAPEIPSHSSAVTTGAPATTSARPLSAYSAGTVLALQRSIGNRATAALLGSSLGRAPHPRSPSPRDAAPSGRDGDRTPTGRLARRSSAGSRRLLQRDYAGCASLTTDSEAVSLLSGSVVHRLIEAHFLSTTAGARKVTIPGASASPQRSEGICGDDTTVIPPQALGGAAGAGRPDLARVTPSGILQVAEIKPAATVCLVDGEEQLLRYIDQGNARDPEQAAWRASEGVTVVTPMPESAYPPPELSTPIADIRTAWCTAGLMGYSVRPRGSRIRVPVVVSKAEREESREQYRESGRDKIPAAAAAAAAAVTVVAGRALWRHFWRAVATRFALRGAVAVGLAAADGPLPFGELIDLGIAVATAIEIFVVWNDLWRAADEIAAHEA